MRRVRFFVAMALLACVWSCAGQREKTSLDQGPPPQEPLAFGSTAVLQAGWTPALLAGKPQDRQVGPAGKADETPPDRTAPETVLPPLPPALRGNIRSVSPQNDRKLVALTFDLCETAVGRTGYDSEIVNTLRAKSIKATFFVGGKWMRSHPDKAQQLMADPLFEVGNHTWTHGNLGVLTGEAMARQILWTQGQYELLREQLMSKPALAGVEARDRELVPRAMTLVRLPYGRCSPETLQFLAEHGLAAIQWNVDSRDTRPGATAEDVAKRVAFYVGKNPGSIVRFHGNGQAKHTAKALPVILSRLQKEGWEFVTVSELLAAGQPEAAEECYYSRPGDSLVFDKRVGDGTRLHQAAE